MSEPSLRRTASGYIWDSGDAFTFEKCYDQDGNYTGQWQMDVMGDGDLFLTPDYDAYGNPLVNGEPVPPLTADEMKAAL